MFAYPDPILDSRNFASDLCCLITFSITKLSIFYGVFPGLLYKYQQLPCHGRLLLVSVTPLGICLVILLPIHKPSNTIVKLVSCSSPELSYHSISEQHQQKNFWQKCRWKAIAIVAKSKWNSKKYLVPASYATGQHPFL